MLTAKQNMIECVSGGNPDRYVNQFEAIKLLFHPALIHGGRTVKGGPDIVNAWGVTMSYPENTPGAFPVHTPEKIVVKDIEHWRDYVTAPELDFPQADWDMFKAMYEDVDHDKAFTTTFFAPGVFEQIHNLCSITAALEYYMTDPDEMHDMVKYITEWELKCAEQICANLKPEMMLHHDDWGSGTNSFLRPSMFEDFFLDAYKEIYGYYHDHGVKYIMHHADSYCANIVDDMIEMGIDIWQGCMQSNDVPALVEKYKGKITFMGNIDNKSVDFNGWTDENCRNEVRRAMDAAGMTGYIPCITQGGSGSVYPGVYTSMTKEIDIYNAEKFGHKVEDIEAARIPLEILF